MLSADESWFKDAVIYEAPVKSFLDSNGDGIGDFAGMIEKLDYIRDLGVDCIWLLPMYPSPLHDDGYDIADFYDIHRDYGTIDDFKLADLSANGSLYAQRPTLFTYIAERKEFDRRAKALFKAIKDGEIKIHVNQTFTLDRVKDAHDAMEKRQTTGQTVLIVE